MPLARIPRRVVFPFNYRITVTQLPNGEMDALASDCDGVWDCDAKTVYIRKALPLTRRRYILAHELGHAWLDWQHLYLNSGKSKT